MKALCSLLICIALFAAGDATQRKFDSVESGTLAAGTRVNFTAAELESWATKEARTYAPGATQNIRLQTGASEATATLFIDFLKLRQAATHEDPGWLFRNLFAGERPVKVVARFESRARRARVNVVRVEISGVVLEGSVLAFAIENLVRPTFPDVKVNEWFDLGFRMDRFTVTPAGVAVFIGK